MTPGTGKVPGGDARKSGGKGGERREVGCVGTAVARGASAEAEPSRGGLHAPIRRTGRTLQGTAMENACK